jgi:hypothetical protein
MVDPFITILQKALVHGSRSTVLKPLAWLVGICSVASIAAFHFKSPAWIGTMFGILAGGTIIFYLIAYVYFGLTDKDTLRSEKFSLQKLAIQKGFIGDDFTGYIKISDRVQPPLLPAETDQKEQEDK